MVTFSDVTLGAPSFECVFTSMDDFDVQYYVTWSVGHREVSNNTLTSVLPAQEVTETVTLDGEVDLHAGVSGNCLAAS